ncbi:Charged multivesicular body protein 7 [Nowakowskiella sp. JEL0078]|nr:Charged multivesicular body protein 7 [Nowakowskiella sp. JEL0078]
MKQATLKTAADGLDQAPSEKPDSVSSLILSLPESKNNRLPFLYSNFKPKNVNPSSYNDRLLFWKNTLEVATRSGLLSSTSSTTFCAEGLDVKFTHNGLRPLGLDIVLDELSNSGDLIELNTYRNYRTWAGWAFDSAFYLASIPFQLAFGPTKRNLSTNTFVNTTLLKSLADKALNKINGDIVKFSTDRIMSQRELNSFLSEVQEMDIELILKFWERTNVVIIQFDAKSGSRFPKDQKEYTSGITPIDSGIVIIKETLHALHSQADDLDKQIDQLNKETKIKLAESNKSRAMFALKRRHALEKILSARLGSIETIENILSRIQSAETDTQVLEAYKSGSETLKSLLPSIDSVESTMSQLQDTLADAQEIENAIQTGIVGTIGENDQDLEIELDALLAAEKETKKRESKHVERLEKTESLADDDLKELEALEVEFGELIMSEKKGIFVSN